MAFLYKAEPVRGAAWARLFAECRPDLPFRIWPEVGDPAEIRFLAAWELPEDLARFPRLEILFSVGAGVNYGDEILATRPVGAVLVLFIDQLEELFTLVPSWRRHAFGELLARAAEHRRLLVLTTLRADFLPEYAAEPALSALLQTDAFVLGPPGPAALVDMIRRPAELAGLVLEEGLVDGILRDAAGEPGEALPLVAFCLEELYRRKTPGRHITLQAYHAMGGLRGAIGRRAGELLAEVRGAEWADLDTALSELFRALVQVDAVGKTARGRAPRAALMTAPAPVPQLVEALVHDGLLLVESVDGRGLVMLAHHALLQEWPALREWLERHRAQIQRVQRSLLGLAATEREDRQHAARILGAIGPAAAAAVPALATSLEDMDSAVRQTSAEALRAIGPAAATAVPMLATTLGDADAAVRQSSAEALGAIGPAAAEAVPVLARALGDPDADVRRACAEALGAIGPAAAETMPALACALYDVAENVRRAAARALGMLGALGSAAVQVIPALATALGDADAPVRRAAAQALGVLGPAAVEAVPALAGALSDANERVRRAAAEALDKLRSAST